MADHTVPHQACPQLSATQKHTPETPHVTYLQRIGKPVYLELCIDASRYTTLLGEIVIVDGMGQQLIHTDVELFTAIRQKYDSMKRGGLFPYMFKPTDIQYVLFGVHGGSASIFRSPLSLPPQVEVDDKRYHYFLGTCPYANGPADLLPVLLATSVVPPSKYSLHRALAEEIGLQHDCVGQ